MTSTDSGQILDRRLFGVVAALSFGHSFIQGVGFALSIIITSFSLGFPFSRAGQFQLQGAFSVYSFLISPFLLFLILYRFFSRDFANRTSTLLISIIIGSALGNWLGVFIGVIAVPILTSGSVSVELFSGSGPFLFGEDILVGFLATAAGHLNREWDDRISKAGFVPLQARPGPILVTSILYLISGALTLSVIPLLSLLPYFNSFSLLALLIVLSLPLINGIVQVLVGYGLFKGRRWGWMLALFGSLLGVTSNIGLTYSLLVSDASTSLLGIVLIFASMTSLALSILVLILLLTRQSRFYCRMVNPPILSSPPPS